MNQNETIIAQSSAAGAGVRGIIRISGDKAVSCVRSITTNDFSSTIGKKENDCQLPFINYSHITIPGFPSFPVKLFIWRTGHSYTGEEIVEIHTVGSQVILNKITDSILSFNENVRLAKPGEFTLRAFLSGRLDLTQAEAVLGVIEAADTVGLKTALQQLAGNVATPLSETRTMLLNLLTEIEAGLDFAEEDIIFVEPETMRHILTKALRQIENLRKQIDRRSLQNEKPKVVLIGKPNTGKSTLFNKLLGTDSAIVSNIEGTTLDYLEGETVFGGIVCTLIDTEGTFSRSADDVRQPFLPDVFVYCYETEPEPINGTNVLYYQTKRKEESIDDLRSQIGQKLREPAVMQTAVLLNTALRCKEAAKLASEAIHRALELTDESLVALEVRNAVNHLGLIDGSVHTDDILDRIFSRFCIGK